jgi:hypothetical protein
MFNHSHSFFDQNQQNTCCDAMAAPFVASLLSACFEASFGKPTTEKQQPSFLRLASQQEKP